jgi:hypothetical protein
MNFVEILKLLQIFEVLVKKICINYKMYSKTLIIIFVCVNHTKQHNGGWKSFMPLKKLQFSLPHVVDAKLVMAINHSISKKFQKFKID